jgi:hypothetical protein
VPTCSTVLSLKPSRPTHSEVMLSSNVLQVTLGTVHDPLTFVKVPSVVETSHVADLWRLCRDELTGGGVRTDGRDIRGRWFSVVVVAAPRLGELPRGQTIPWRTIAAQIASRDRRGTRCPNGAQPRRPERAVNERSASFRLREADSDPVWSVQQGDVVVSRIVGLAGRDKPIDEIGEVKR